MAQTTVNHTQTVQGWAAHDSSGKITPHSFKRRENGVDDVTIKILYCGICHTDLHHAKDDWGITMYPVVPGHEIIGIITKVGSNVSNFKVGDRAGVGCLAATCLKCELCKEGQENYCDDVQFSYNGIFWDGSITYGGYSEFLVADYRSEKVCAQGVDSTTTKQWKLEAKCGRPLGLRFDTRSGNLYIADAYYGLMVVGPQGGLATPLASHVDGKPILFANDLDVHENGSIFFTDTSKKYNRVDHFFILLEGEATGRLLRYDPHTKTTTVVLEGLAFPNGVQLSKDQSFLVYTETTNCRIMKYYLEGPKTGATEVVADLPGFPDNIRMNERGDFWVAIDCCRTATQEIFMHHPWLRNIYFRLPIPMKYLAKFAGMRMYTMVAELNEKGEILDVLDDKRGEVMKLVSEVREANGKLWIGTVAHNHIATIPYPLQNI